MPGNKTPGRSSHSALVIGISSQPQQPSAARAGPTHDQATAAPLGTQGDRMFEDIRTALTELRDYFAWAPDWLVSAAMLVLAALLALIVHSIVIRLILRLLRERHLHLRAFLSGT